MKNNPEEEEYGSGDVSRVLMRLLDSRKTIDYAIAFIIGAFPIACAAQLGLHHTKNYSCSGMNAETYRGYYEFPNWWSLAFLLPALLFAFRWVMSKNAPVHEPRAGERIPPILNLLKDPNAKAPVYTKLRQEFLSSTNLTAALAIVLVVHVLDMWPVVTPYLTGEPADFKDWRNMALFEKALGVTCTPERYISRTENLVVLAGAYFAQFSAVFVGVISIVLFLRHNLFFLRNIYQRRWVSPGEASRYFQIDPKDVNRCFGFRLANEAFNTQVLALMIAGLAMSISRYVSSVGYAGDLTDLFNWPPVVPELSFPFAGQWLMAVLWIVALGVVALPAFVKLLPRLPERGSERAHLSISHYLREFFSDEAWPKDKAKKDEPVPRVAARFAANSFWPSGDNRAGILFFFSYWIFFVTLLPPSIHDFTYLLFSTALFGMLAYLAKLATFKALKWALGYVDELLVAEGDSDLYDLDSTDFFADGKPDTGIFISYRRQDTAEYARSLAEALEEHFKEDRVFRDISDIRPGDNFVEAIDSALASVDAVIVLIGPRWLSISNEAGEPRIHDPGDMVHIEVLTALEHHKRIIPVLVGGATMPKGGELPVSIRKLSQINALEISNMRWDYDVGRLVDTLKAGQ